MDFSLNDEQQMLADLVARFVERQYDFEARRKLAATPRGWSTENWAALAETGLLALALDEQYGGLGAGAEEVLVVMEGFGRGLVLEPYLSSALVAAQLLQRVADESAKVQLLPLVASGECRVSLAALEPQARFDLWDVACEARPADAGFRLNGRKSVVAHGDSADWFIVSARTAGARDDRHGISLFLVDARAQGVSVRGFPGLDGQRVAEVELRDVFLPADALLGAENLALAELEWAADRACFALSAEAVGCMARLTELTVEYLQTRKQFGKPIGSFQALQHRVAEMLGFVEQARSITCYAAANLDNEDVRLRGRAVSAAKALIGKAGRFIGQQAVQLHGGMGMTDELAVGWYFKRLTVIDMTWGDSDHHVERYGTLL
ncbi:pimeloyl-CoA dehydrogenase small subunit [Pseudomonas nicosulfuronedens]|uniref:Pimeloyl-CoA dehydrogenase small subunit n=1 Tax=Pseudomonas nicosulfuronedens TaxID=2571105 RepID=A0A5R9QNV3_9PSED|nr:MULTISPECIES: acyl-CoA dehydrogenase family protein [Pseudomonas]TLX71344.1 pimeloyl-CoA dehydrogenase small subunit [Pseudomonas nicosulfuronedens]